MLLVPSVIPTIVTLLPANKMPVSLAQPPDPLQQPVAYVPVEPGVTADPAIPVYDTFIIVSPFHAFANGGTGLEGQRNGWIVMLLTRVLLGLLFTKPLWLLNCHRR